ncbi:ABC transporter substrate-binding protein [Kitasatospora sp. NPDC050543]|uniref:ABC transporter substrate-binding protein n=1 Tax=Kitasatospora sp. NPDC050543 TaxID=3364054 RepID=UPI0037A79329
MHVNLTLARTVAAIGAGALLLTGCGSGTVTATPGSPADLRARVPKAFKNAGVLKIGSDLNYAPVDFRGQNAEPAGLDPELAAALGNLLGLRVEFVDMPFEKLIPALQAKQIDLVMAAVIDTQQRQRGVDDNGQQVNPGVDFVDYYVTGTSLLVQAGNPLGITTLDGLCGHTIAMQRGTIQAEMAQRQTVACGRAAKPLTIHLRDTDAQALAEMAAGTAVADLVDYPVAEYNLHSQQWAGRFAVAGSQHQVGPYGITVDKGNGGLRDALAKALDVLIRNGEYGKILAKWNLQAGAIQSAVINSGL